MSFRRSTSSAGAHPVNRSVRRTHGRKSKKTHGGSGPTSRRPSPTRGRVSSSSRMCRGCVDVACESCWPILPLSGSMRTGRVSEQETSAPRTEGKGSSSSPGGPELWPTPTVNDSRNGANATAGRGAGKRGHSGTTLVDAVRLWPTPTAQRYGSNRGGAAGRVGKVRHSLDQLAKLWPTPTASLGQKGVRTKAGAAKEVARTRGPDLNAAVLVSSGRSGKLNPEFVAWLMGVPTEWLG